MRLTILIIGFTFFMSLQSMAQQNFPADVFHVGKLVLFDDQDTLFGKIKYNLDLNVVQYESNKGSKTFGARQVHYFEIEDNTVNNLRYFYSLPFANDGRYEVPMFFEVLIEGEVSLLTRERLITESIPSYNSYYANTTYQSVTRLSYDFFMVRPGSDIQQYFGKKNELELEFFSDKSQEIQAFIRRNKLRPDEKKDLIRIVYYYNSLN